MRIAFSVLVGASLLGAAVPAVAQNDTTGRISAGITGGSLGIGPELGYRFSNNVGIRANATFLNFSHGIDSDDIDYDGKLRLRSGGAMVDVFPFGGGLFVSGGARINGNRGRVVATPTQPTRVGNVILTPAQIGTLRGRGDTRDFAPQLTLGYSGKFASGFFFGAEAGALFQGRVRVSTLTASNSGVAAADLERERASIQDDVDDYKVYPILQLRVGYRF